MTLSYKDIREGLNKEKYKAEQNREKIQEYIGKLKDLSEQVSEEELEELASLSVDFRFVKNIDFERASKDTKYVMEIKQRVGESSEKFKELMTEILQ